MSANDSYNHVTLLNAHWPRASGTHCSCTSRKYWPRALPQPRPADRCTSAPVMPAAHAPATSATPAAQAPATPTDPIAPVTYHTCLRPKCRCCPSHAHTLLTCQLRMLHPHQLPKRQPHPMPQPRRPRAHHPVLVRMSMRPVLVPSHRAIMVAGSILDFILGFYSRL
ncbi:hypothetical protein FIBSPDRAFT_855600 [Athelia psychrophila]|uniref:Uncharacterized protein n=1 Tax=Athelia psychrophila TaxID=1759441 RepID=A0A166P381_9AGAM|nr:hypothetical protein FIBSPDRAFT_876887 [Fibularhizoctonia sp. CBS 109695]KZP25666.1 hypothetical protein FIBSPDRAFT_855600 [Fibularhizoctonia sp. CBS 109695]